MKKLRPTHVGCDSWSDWQGCCLGFGYCYSWAINDVITMKRYEEFWKSLIVYLPTGGIISYGVYSGNLLSAIIVGYIGALSIFFVPTLYKKYLKK